MAVETARASPNRRNVPKVYTKMTERHQMRTLTKNQMALFFWNGVVFCRCKFYNKEHHGTYNEKPTSFGGIVLKYCYIIANNTWWYYTRKMIVLTHRNHCNNYIKAVKLKLKGTQFQHEMHSFFNLTHIVQFKLVHYQKDAPN